FTGMQRFTFGSLELVDGLDLIAIVIGLFAITEMMKLAKEGGSISKAGKMTGSILRGLGRPFKYPLTLFRSAGIGTLFGAIPGLGMTQASFFSYNEAMRKPKDKKTPFGEGNEEGLVAAESANNATVGGALIPALTLGIPGSESTALFLSALY